MIRFHCPSCDARMEVDESFGGRAARCPTCSHELKIPTAADAAAAAKGSPRSGAAVIDVDGEKVEVRPPIEATAKLSAGLVCAAVVAWAAGTFGPFAANSWAFGGLVGALLAALGAIMSLPAYQTIKRSHGGKRGTGMATAGLIAGAVLFVVFMGAATYGLVTFKIRPPCEENLKQIYAALMKYADAHDGAFPKDMGELVRGKFLDSDQWITCPAYQDKSIGTQTYQLTPDVNIKNPMFPPDMMIVCDGPPYNLHEDGFVRILVLRGEGDASPIKLVSTKEWPAFQKGQSDRWNDIMNRIRNPAVRRTPPPAKATGTAAPAPATPTPTAPPTPTPTAPATSAPAAPPIPAPAPAPAAPLAPMPPLEAPKGDAK